MKKKGDSFMITKTISAVQKELSKIVSSCVENDEVIKITTKEGNIIMINEKRYNNLIESLYLVGVKGVYEDIKEAIDTPTNSFLKGDPRQ